MKFKEICSEKNDLLKKIIIPKKRKKFLQADFVFSTEYVVVSS